MSREGPVRRARAAAGPLLIFLASCAGGADTTTDQVATTTTTPPQDTGTTATATASGTSPPIAAACEEPATEIAIGSPVSSEIVAEDQGIVRLYYCVEIPDGVSSVTFDLTGMTADLDLFVGYPDLATLQEGGLGLWFSDNANTDDEQVVVEPGFEQEFVGPGAYYTEVSSDSLEGSSPFTLNVSTG